jgi:hypothetical protein
MRVRILFIGSALALLAAGCGGGEAGPTTVVPSSTVPTTSTPPAPSTTTLPTTTTSTTTTTAAPTTTTIPGDPIDFGPPAGDVLAVVGVSHEDVLNMRAAPGIDQPIVATLDPLEDDVIALGNARQLPTSIWFQIEVDGTIGWASAAFLAYRGDTTDVTSAVVADLGEVPEAETMLDLGRIVVEALASDAPESRIVVSVAPTVGDLGEVTYDVTGLGDDALFGLRLHVFGTPSDSLEGFVLEAVEQTSLCGRGVSNGLCV